MLLRVFFQFFDNSPILSGVRDELVARTVEQNVPATVDRILNEDAIFGYELRLMSSMNGVSDISTEGKKLITVTSVDDVLRLRIFDGDGKVVLDKDENKLTGRAPEIEDLRKKLVGLWPPHELKRPETKQIVAAVAAVVGRTPLFGRSESELAAMGYHFLKKIADQPGEDMIYKIGSKYRGNSEPAEKLDIVRELFLESFYEYIDEHLDDQQAILYFLRRYKHRCEWFHAERLREEVKVDTQMGEKTLALDLYEYLHDQGIDFHVEPRSASGIPDFVADQVGKERVIADTKLFWPERSKGKPYIISGFNQAYIYACDYNEPCAYLVIFKMRHEGLNFLVPSTQASFPSLTVNNKTIFFIVVDIFEYGTSASKRGPMKSVDITEQELVQRVEVDQRRREDLPEVEAGLNAGAPEQT